MINLTKLWHWLTGRQRELDKQYFAERSATVANVGLEQGALKELLLEVKELKEFSKEIHALNKELYLQHVDNWLESTSQRTDLLLSAVNELARKEQDNASTLAELQTSVKLLLESVDVRSMHTAFAELLSIFGARDTAITSLQDTLRHHGTLLKDIIMDIKELHVVHSQNVVSVAEHKPQQEKVYSTGLIQWR